MKKINYAGILKETGILTVAVAIIAAAVYFFLVPSHASVSSISGLGIVLSNFIPLPLSVITMILNVVLLLIGFVTCGKEFGVKTVYTSVMLPVFLGLFEMLFPNFGSMTDSQELDVLCYILVVSVGLSILFNRNASSGGLDIVVQTMSQEQMGSVLKHFPGYGNNSDTHTGIAYDERPIEGFVNSDFLPFQAGIDAGADMVLVAHNVVSCMDDQVPASISLPVHNILRNELGFDGVIITDDLVMEGVRQFAGDAEIAVRAVQAGNDMLCCTDFEVQVPAVIKAVETGEITEERLNESVLRILKMKIKLGIIADYQNFSQ